MSKFYFLLLFFPLISSGCEFKFKKYARDNIKLLYKKGNFMNIIMKFPENLNPIFECLNEGDEVELQYKQKIGNYLQPWQKRCTTL